MKAGDAEPRTLAANQARRRSTQNKLQSIEETLRKLRRERVPITYPAVARRAGVSRTFLYQNPDAKTLMAKATIASRDQRRHSQIKQDAQVETSWRERALNAEDALKTAYTEIGTQRHRVGLLLSQIRDLEADYTEQAAQRLLGISITSALRWTRRAARDWNAYLSTRT